MQGPLIHFPRFPAVDYFFFSLNLCNSISITCPAPNEQQQKKGLYTHTSEVKT